MLLKISLHGSLSKEFVSLLKALEDLTDHRVMGVLCRKCKKWRYDYKPAGDWECSMDVNGLAIFTPKFNFYLRDVLTIFLTDPVKEYENTVLRRMKTAFTHSPLLSIYAEEYYACYLGETITREWLRKAKIEPLTKEDLEKLEIKKRLKKDLREAIRQAKESFYMTPEMGRKRKNEAEFVSSLKALEDLMDHHVMGVLCWKCNQWRYDYKPVDDWECSMDVNGDCSIPSQYTEEEF